ncbi:hypothetical protein HUU05_16615 [candidate division KSB1 bacterium]|nr:hypothetical protein [candidate division KSB1 bacterium]
MERIIVADEDAVLRRIPNKPSHIKSDGTLSSANFIGPDTSVNIERLTTIADTMHGYESCGLVRPFTHTIREHGEDVIHDPTADNFAHAIIPGKRTISVARKLALQSEIILLPNLTS